MLNGSALNVALLNGPDASGNGSGIPTGVVGEFDTAFPFHYSAPAPLLTPDRRTAFRLSEDFTFSPLWPPVDWRPRESAIGGTAISGAGIPASYRVRRDSYCEITLRVLEAEWTSFLNFLALAQEGGSFLWYPTLDDSEGFPVYLESPAPGDRFQPDRQSDYPKMLHCQLTLRGMGGPPWTPFYSGLPE